jgi:hypothetical protein
MKAIENAKRHFDSLGIKKIEVPEWGDEGQPLIIYAKPLTLAEMSRLQKYAKDNDVELMAHCIIQKALDENMEKIFDLGDKHDLMHHVDKDVLARVAGDIMTSITVEEQEKK